MEKIAIIVPALDKNRYSDKGDLESFGDMTLLEWKINQLKGLRDIANIYITTPSEKIKTIMKNEKSIEIISRDSNMSFEEVVTSSASKVKEETIMWTNSNSPFISEKLYKELLEEYINIDVQYDSLVIAREMSEYIFYQGKALNFDVKKHVARKNVGKVYKLTNGASIMSKELFLKYKKLFGENPYLRTVDKLSGHEINDVEGHNIAIDLMSLYFKKTLNYKP